MIKKILIIDDSPIMRRMVKRCLPKDRGFEISEAVDGSAGMEKLKEVGPDVIFLDLTMPIMDGRAVLKELKNMDLNCIVIVCTADIQQKSIEEVMALGAFEIIKKPPSPDSIQNALSKAEEKLREIN